ncbi:YfbM family protein [Roseateles sp.]|uniref:YfbM family protein n=1 Tax=Roseateles sp. TaxID=1971397 RepID=UPI002E06BA82|nr:YfbM family protein [Roseateles sp.]
MGMTASFVAVTPAELEAFKGDATALPDFFFERLAEVMPEKANQALDIDKSWAAIHFMLTGTLWGGEPPESLPILGGSEIGADMGYGPLRYLTPPEVNAAHGVLAQIPAAELKKRFIPEKLEEAEVYPSGIWLEEGEEGFEYIEYWYEQLRTFYASAAQAGHAVLLAVV